MKITKEWLEEIKFRDCMISECEEKGLLNLDYETFIYKLAGIAHFPDVYTIIMNLLNLESNREKFKSFEKKQEELMRLEHKELSHSLSSGKLFKNNIITKKDVDFILELNNKEKEINDSTIKYALSLIRQEKKKICKKNK